MNGSVIRCRQWKSGVGAGLLSAEDRRCGYSVVDDLVVILVACQTIDESIIGGASWR